MILPQLTIKRMLSEGAVEVAGRGVDMAVDMGMEGRGEEDGEEAGDVGVLCDTAFDEMRWCEMKMRTRTRTRMRKREGKGMRRTEMTPCHEPLKLPGEMTRPRRIGSSSSAKGSVQLTSRCQSSSFRSLRVGLSSSSSSSFSSSRASEAEAEAEVQGNEILFVLWIQ